MGKRPACRTDGSRRTRPPTTRRQQALNAKVKQIHDDGLVTQLKQRPDEIDATVLVACGWSDPSSAGLPFADLLARGGPEAKALAQELPTRLVAPNHDRATNEKRVA